MKRLTTLLLALAGATTAGCIAPVGDDCQSETRCGDGSDGSGSGSATARDCSDPDDVSVEDKSITITSDADFAKLPKGCWGLNGTLRLQGSAITSLEKLGDLVDVNNLEIVDTQLTTFDSLQQVTVYGHIKAQGNSKLTTFEKVTAQKWPGSTPLAGDTTSWFLISDNAELTNINGLKYLTTIGDYLQLENLPKLASIEFLELTNITGLLTIKNTGATQVKFPQLRTLAGLDVSQNANLAMFGSLAAANILGDVTFRANPKLLDIGTMSSLSLIGRNLTIDDNDQLASLGGLFTSMQRIVGSVTISNNQVLANLGLLSHLSLGIGLTVSITNNPVLGYCKAYEVDRCVNSGTVTNTGNGQQQTCQTWCN